MLEQRHRAGERQEDNRKNLGYARPDGLEKLAGPGIARFGETV
jgi:hypothetical protein